MSNQAWFTKYRPKSFAQLHLPEVSQQFTTWQKKGQIPQVLLLVGPRGAGKTSTARIVAATLNQSVDQKKLLDPDYSQPEIAKIIEGKSSLVREIDAASHRGIDDIRQLKQELGVPPLSGTHLVYILDEVHMLTNEAFNALLKVLEEPPGNTHFILATTEPHKIPETITSRCTEVRYRKATTTEITQLLTQIVKQEKLKVETPILELLAATVDGSFRDAIKLLQQLAQQNILSDAQQVRTYLGLSSDAQLAQLCELLFEKKPKAITDFFIALRSSTTQPKDFHLQWLQFLYQQLVLSHRSVQETLHQKPLKVWLFLLEQFHQPYQTEIIPFLNVELKCLELVAKATANSESDSSNSRQSSKPSNSESAQKINKQQSESKTEKKSIQVEVQTKDTVVPSVETEFSAHQVVQAVSSKHSVLGSLLAAAKLRWHQSTLLIETQFSFHKEQLEKPQHLSVLQQVCQELLGESAVKVALAKSNQEYAQQVANILTQS